MATNEMTARRSFEHSMGKYVPRIVDKPVAIITAWRGQLDAPNGQPYPEAERRRLNDAANELLANNIRQRGLSYYPVVGVGQEVDSGEKTTNKENSFIVEPIDAMNEQEFIDHIQHLLFNPTGAVGNGPFTHSQWGATVKLPSYPMAFTLSRGGAAANDAADYCVYDD